jgi:hypothetical protein
MRVTTCTINVGKGIGNRTMAMECFSFADVFFVLEPPRGKSGEHVPHENDVYEVFSFCKGSRVEVFIRRCMIGLFSLVKHLDFGACLEYCDEEGRKCIEGVYIWPNTGKEEMKGILREMRGWDILVGDFNSRHETWDKEGTCSL